MGYIDFIKRLRPITGDQLEDETIDTDQIADGAITSDKLAANAVVLADIEDGTITNGKLSSTAVTESVTVAKTFTHASLSDTAGVLGSQLGKGTLHQTKTSIGHANGTPVIAVLPPGALLVDAWVVCTETYDATAPTINIGYSGSTDVILPTASISKTSGNVSGDDPSVRGTDLWVPGVFSGGSLSAGSQTKTPAAIGLGTQTTTAGPPADFTVTAWPALASGGDWSVTQGTLTPATITTYGHARRKFYATSTTVIATIAGASGNTAGTMDVYLTYIQTA
jgi:hypothetical protein